MLWRWNGDARESEKEMTEREAGLPVGASMSESCVLVVVDQWILAGELTKWNAEIISYSPIS